MEIKLKNNPLYGILHLTILVLRADIEVKVTDLMTSCKIFNCLLQHVGRIHLKLRLVTCDISQNVYAVQAITPQ